MSINIEEIKAFVRSMYYYMGINKQQEISRLLYEISKRENINYSRVAECLPRPPARFLHVKDHLLKRRYPSISKNGGRISQSFGSISINPELEADLSLRPEIKPKNLFIEESVLNTETAQRIISQFQESNVEIIKTYREYIKHRQFSIFDYNHRRETFFLISEKYDFYKQCPCSNNSVSCGYNVVNLGSGCPFECVYCILQDYINSPGIIIPANIEDFFTAFKDYKQDICLGSGELTDSLVFDNITGYSVKIVEFFRQFPKTIFEFKTKSNNVNLLTSVPGAQNIVVSWSVNPQSIVETVEHFTATLAQRLEAAQKCINRGYRIAFHFDPIIYYKEWENDYECLVNTIFGKIDGTHIAWISLGTLRMTSQLKKTIENRFPNNTILDEEFLVGYDGKLRYTKNVRTYIYKNMMSWIRKHNKHIPVYLCMEEKLIV